MRRKTPTRKTLAKENTTTARARLTTRPTIRDVSVLAGVSRMTVSRVIREPALVRPATHEAVQKAIAHLGYVPDLAAGGLSSRHTGFIALMLPTLTNTNFAAAAHGLTEALRLNNYHLLIAYTDYSLGEEERQLKNLLARRPEAIVLTGASHRRNAAKMLLASDIPVIEIADLPSQPLEHAIGFSNYQAGRTAARYLIDRQFKRIGAVASAGAGDVIDHRGEERMRGFEDELRSVGLRTDLVLRHGEAPVSYDHGAAVIALLLKREPRIDAVFAVSDLSAVGVVMECQRRGINVPADVSVIGFGDFDIGRVINPALTTIHVDFRALGQRTGELILTLLASERSVHPTLIDVGLKVIERASVRNLP
jgi:LacI family transcriptional regulator, gluconate utilization system Gnt-I transcriptional repressor